MKRLRKQILFLAFCIALTLLYTGSASAAPMLGYIVDQEGYRIPTPLGYSVIRVISGDYQHGNMRNPEDLFIDKQDRLYVTDTENNRVLKMDKQGNILKVFGTEQDQLGFMEPKGIYVDDDGDLFIADTGNSQIVHLSPEGEKIEAFTAPKSDLIDKDFPFTPTKLAIDRGGSMYVQSGNDYHGLMVIDGNNTFQGYIAPNKLKFNLKDWILRTYATKEQREALGKQVPPNHRNVTIDNNNGYLYTAIENTQMDEIKRFNFLGINTYLAGKSYGEISVEDGSLTTPNIVDLAVDASGIITAVDSSQRKVYQYDQEGNMLVAFGGRGEQTGFFQEPVSVAVDSKGLIYVLDRNLGQIQVFQANHFASLVQQASRLYHEGRYDEALKPWREVLKIDANYNLGHRGVGKALYKQGAFKAAMTEFRLGEDKGNYSKAFQEYRHQLLRQQFIWIVLISVAILAAVYYAFVLLAGYSRRLEFGSLGKPAIENAALIIFNPKESFARIQASPNMLSASLLLAGVICTRFIEIYFTRFHFATTRPEFANLWMEGAQIIVPFLTWVVSAWAITSIMDGESKFKHIFVGSAYALLPYIIGTLLKTLLSNVLSLEEAGVWELISTGIWVWTAVSLIFLLVSMNDYTIGKTVKVILVTLFTMIALLAVCILFYVLLNHVFDFVKELFLELYIRSF